ncbi:MAG: acyltransferase [Clostridiales bacterium]|nr:acyltransferase [Clostridiales bacterium]
MSVTELEKPVSKVTARRPRALYLDLLRCYAIVCVVLLHALVPLLSDTKYFGTNSWLAALAINPFCRTGVAIFLMISGHLLLNDPLADDMSRFYKKRLPRLMVPLLVWNVVYYLYYALVWGLGGGIGGFFTQLINSGTAYHMWYVYTLIGIYLLTPYLKKITDACSKGQVAGLFFLIIGMTTIRPFINTTASIYIHLFEPLMQGYIGYFLLGYLLGSVDFSRAQRALFYLGGAAGYVVNVAFGYARSTPEALDYSMNAGYALPRFLFAAAIFVLFRQIFGKSEGAVVRLASKFAGLTFGIYWVHVIALLEVSERLALDMIPIVETLVQFVIAFAASAAVAALLNLIKPVRKYLL